MVNAVLLNIVAVHLHLCAFAAINQVKPVFVGKNLCAWIPVICRNGRATAQDGNLHSHQLPELILPLNLREGPVTV
ncbi:MAG: hypothetical protein BWY70_01404 [Bacteroidetes bacterium ADurb.Bin408]|nr:MAG: hypothetical protein BWY70_01404 [Bacteroidetes bacterium ADurb.Bin408]